MSQVNQASVAHPRAIKESRPYHQITILEPPPKANTHQKKKTEITLSSHRSGYSWKPSRTVCPSIRTRTLEHETEKGVVRRRGKRQAREKTKTYLLGDLVVDSGFRHEGGYLPLLGRRQRHGERFPSGRVLLEG